MFSEFHFIRPLWLSMFILLLLLMWHLWHRTLRDNAWSEVCDSELLQVLMQNNGESRRWHGLLWLFASMCLMIISLAGPTWSRYPVPTYKPIVPRILLLDMTGAMLNDDLPPNRLTRAKFKLHDLFVRQDVGQFGLVVYTGEPFVASPLTDDGNTINSLLDTLTPDVMPVGGHRLDAALWQAKKLISQAGFDAGDILVLTAQSPANTAINAAKKLSQEGFHTSIMPILGAGEKISPLYKEFASAGDGAVIKMQGTSKDLEKWLGLARNTHKYNEKWRDEVPVWRDEGRWLLLPALMLLASVFRRGWLQRLDS